MALPKLNVPKYKLKLPSDGRTVNYRPFLVKEEKLLLLATETGEQEEIIGAIKNIITQCTDITSVDKLATFDIEYLFLQIRTKSVGENVDVMVTCPDDGETEVEISIPLDDIKVVKTRGHKKELKLDDEIAVTMGYPNLESFVESNFGEDTNQIEQIFEMAAGCIETIADTNQIYECKDLPKSEILEFLDQLSSKQFGELQKFFETMPKLSHTVQVTNPNTGVESEVVLEGLASFFA
ncbi:baseplate hub subunit [Cyanophage S-RIM12_RW_29_1109]|uniref:Baseplate hub subunit n=4 Tax=Brizovirus syn33 TaxID=2734097 RepID=A0A1D7SVF5_9CAUD|nr:baseplate hub [Prochlorococcus phage Syn33]AOO15500.1 baseplate hub subunit [Cyanophage S-RIM12_Np_22_1112]AOO16571.1 baseplate hub subunit [Cyanophage S-RIM12_RW_07_1112]AOO16787.1 baseplate hub subunit [Cyanophage S-RIM12_RW_14_0101]AOO17002.1 baseplate hub subunit [Cyanophage S-RIM12_RW_22_0110]AOO17218.1 baseplate hub subunit [Cyanophage S-RIM12_RW_25_0210]AOO17648.1 baseplate hub subunit [Cyanophage S-RIM12_RW_28_1109]AOO17863.1 baseplate hub subunit [Cyanophage S-RIM12_RW_29_1109]